MLRTDHARWNTSCACGSRNSNCGATEDEPGGWENDRPPTVDQALDEPSLDTQPAGKGAATWSAGTGART